LNQIPTVLPKFIEGLCLYIQNADQGPEAWGLVLELMLRLNAALALPIIESKFTSAYLKNMEAQSHGFADTILSWGRNIKPAQRQQVSAQARLIRRVLVSGYVRDSQTRLTLLRLCEIDPETDTAYRRDPTLASQTNEAHWSSKQ